MQLYARSDVVGVTANGHAHLREAMDEPFVVDCPECETHLLKTGWAKTIEEVELTPEEEFARQKAEKSGNVMMTLFAQKFGDMFTQFVAQNPEQASAALKR